MRIVFFVLILLIIRFLFPESIDSYEKPGSVSAGELREWINYISSDEMRGRANGSPEMKLSADWIAKKFKEFGLEPYSSSQGYFQNYSYNSRQHAVNEKNVIGMIEGSDPDLKNQCILLTAHFDHIGIRQGIVNDSIYNGADDNAAGTCTLIGIAKTIRDLGYKPGRTIVFAAFSGEENGMRGSRFFVANETDLIKRTIVNLNFEMTGHSEYLGKNRFYMTGCKYSNLDEIIRGYNYESHSDWTLIDTIPLANNLFFSSDNIAFSRISAREGISQGIPSGTFATTTTAEYIHSPHDDGILFDYENMSDLVSYFSKLVIWLSVNHTEIMFTDTVFNNIY